MGKRGKFIVFEGIDGSGKTTQVDLLQQRLTAVCKKNKCYVTREPSDSPPGLIARGAIKGTILLSPKTLVWEFIADRTEHVEKVILPHLENGIHVICDWFYFSNFAYQAATVGFERLLDLNREIMEQIRPDMTFFIDTPSEECARRRALERADEELFDNNEDLESARKNYLRAFEELKDIEKSAIIIPRENAQRTFEIIWLKLVKEVFEESDLL